MKRIAVALAHGHVPKWLQTSIYSLQNTRGTNAHEYDIYLAHTWPGHESIKAITENALGRDVTVVPVTRRLYSHAVGLDEILDLIGCDDRYDYVFTCETDCEAKPGWLDWYMSYMTDASIGMAGFFWSEGRNHNNINPSATIYRKDMLVKYHREVRANGKGVFYHPVDGVIQDTQQGMDNSIKTTVGVFSETRGFQNPTANQRDAIERGVPHAAWWEPGQWLYVRHLGEYGGVAVPTEHIYIDKLGQRVPEGTYYNTKANPKFIHYWGGTRCYDFLKHPVQDGFVRAMTPWWLSRENEIWTRVVPQEFRGIVYDIEQKIDVKGMMEKNLRGA